MEKNKYPLHPDFKPWENTRVSLQPMVIAVLQKIMGLTFKKQLSFTHLQVEQIQIPVANQVNMRVLIFSPHNLKEKAPCLIYYHGGGFVFPATQNHFDLVMKYVLNTGCKVVVPDYRLAPKHKFPIPVDDSYATYEYVLENADNLSIDRNRIAVGGDSAGGELATVVAMMARDKGRHMPIGQMLIYPATDRRMLTDSYKKYVDTPLCNSKDCEKYIKYYIPDYGTGNIVYASPNEAATLKDMPKTYIETAEFDCLHDEALEYGKRLEEDNVDVEYNETFGTMHGYDIAVNSSIVKDSIEKRNLFLKKLWNSTKHNMIKEEVEKTVEVDQGMEEIEDEFNDETQEIEEELDRTNI